MSSRASLWSSPIVLVALLASLLVCLAEACSSGTGGRDGGGTAGGGVGADGGAGTVGGAGTGGGAGNDGGAGTGWAGTGGSAGNDGGADKGSNRNPTCVTSNAGCCYLDEDCPDNQECVGAFCGSFGGPGTPPVAIPGVCKQRFAAGGTQCWRDGDCAHHCTGAQVCRCGTACLVADVPGMCTQ
jgi:hypothetical protein